jgi:TPP-dependent pyruvate/acetoin dehydrogenase alpha subunit
MNVLEVRGAVVEAAERARSGQGPTLIECLTYRQCGHSRSDPRTYRTREEEEAWKSKDPIQTFRDHLLAQGLSSKEELAQVEASVEVRIKEAIARAEASPEPEPAYLYTDVFKE